VHRRPKELIAKILVILVLGFPAGKGIPAAQNSDQATLIQQKMKRAHDLVSQRYLDGAEWRTLQPVVDLMHDLGPLMKAKKYAEADALLNRALKLLGDTTATDETAASGDLSLIAYAARDSDGRQQIFVVKPDGTAKRPLTQDGKRNYSPAWSPDGKRLAWVSDRSGSPQTWVMDADGTNLVQLTTEGENVAPTWSNDGKTLAFASKRQGRSEIWVMAADGSHQRPLTATDAGISDTYPAWSPDGRRIAFSSTRSGNLAIWVMNADGGHMTQLTNRYGDAYPDSDLPVWSPDGAKIAFWSGQAGKRDGNIWIINEDGTNPRHLTGMSPGLRCDEPAWSPDGEQIAFTTLKDGHSQIWVMDGNGKNQTSLMSNVEVLPGRLSWQPGNGGQ
jgi:TolB protein